MQWYASKTATREKKTRSEARKSRFDKEDGTFVFDSIVLVAEMMLFFACLYWYTF